MINIRTKQLRAQLDALDIDAWARECGVDSGYTKKIRGRDLLQGFLLMHAQQGTSLESWASCIESFSGQPVSKQAVCQRCTGKHAAFFERVCTEALQRRRKARRDRHTGANHSTGYMRALGWNFFVTNVGPQWWSAATASAVYRLRWRIEIVFKTLKSCFQAAAQLENRADACRSRADDHSRLAHLQRVGDGADLSVLCSPDASAGNSRAPFRNVPQPGT